MTAAGWAQIVLYDVVQLRGKRWPARVIAQVDTVTDGKLTGTTAAPTTSEYAAKTKANREWRISSLDLVNRDDHAVAYDLQLHDEAAYRGAVADAFTANGLYVTEHRPCERLAALNPGMDAAQTSMST